MQPNLDQAELDELARRRSNAAGLEIAGVSVMAASFVLGGALLFLDAVIEYKPRRTARATPRWRVAPVVSRTHGGLDLTLRF